MFPVSRDRAQKVPDNLFPSGGRPNIPREIINDRPLPRAAQIAAAQEAARRAAAPRTGAAEQMAGAVPISLPRQFLEGGFGQALGRPNVNPDIINDRRNQQLFNGQAAAQLAAQGGNRPMMNPMQQNPMFGGLGGLASAMSQAGDFSNPTMMGLGQYGRPPVSQLQAMQNAMQNAQHVRQNMQFRRRRSSKRCKTCSSRVSPQWAFARLLQASSLCPWVSASKWGFRVSKQTCLALPLVATCLKIQILLEHLASTHRKGKISLVPLASTCSKGKTRLETLARVRLNRCNSTFKGPFGGLSFCSMLM
jgi:hypothetical protein